MADRALSFEWKVIMAADDQPYPGEEDNRLNAASKLPGLSRSEQKAVEVQSRPNAALIHETIRAEGESELDRKASALLLSGLAAGLSMGFSLVAEGLLRHHLPDAPWRPLVAHLGYAVGFLIVVLGRQQLFTENTLTPILPLLHRRDAHTFGRLARLWALVLAANVLGTWIVAAALAHSGVFDEGTRHAFSEISRATIAHPFATTFAKAVFAGWLIALMVWLLPAAEGARFIVIVTITYLVALGGFAHIIVGSVESFFLVHTDQASYRDFLSTFFLPTLLGNVVGGVLLVAVLNYGQVASEIG
jgi:formate/nitrite transporter FocA (FNT family)